MSWLRKLFRRSGPVEGDSGAFAQTYGVELLFETPPRLDGEELLRAVRRRCPAAESLDPSGSSGVLMFAHPDHPVPLKDATVHPLTALLPTDRSYALTEALGSDLRQSWRFPGAAEVVARCRHSMLVTDMLSSTRGYKQRLDLFQDALAGLLEALEPLAIHWRPTGQYIDPGRYLEACLEGDPARFHAGPLNVRFYNISNTPGDKIMDTLGLSALGQTDLQCHFRDLDPAQVGAILGDTAYYLFEHGDVIEAGHTIEGHPAGARWRCQTEESLIKPTRLVLDLDPGPPHAAGNRATGD